MKELQPITPREICWSEIDGGLSINPEVVAERLNDLLEMIREIGERRFTRCPCEGEA